MVLDPDILQDASNVADAQSTPTDQQGYLLEYVNKNCYNSSLCLTSVADHMCTSIYAISRTFKDITGVGFKEYVTGKRLQRACQLLTSTDKTIWEIASLAGFENATYFTTVFKNEFGIPPSKFRTIVRKSQKQGR